VAAAVDHETRARVEQVHLAQALHVGSVAGVQAREAPGVPGPVVEGAGGALLAELRDCVQEIPGVAGAGGDAGLPGEGVLRVGRAVRAGVVPGVGLVGVLWTDIAALVERVALRARGARKPARAAGRALVALETDTVSPERGAGSGPGKIGAGLARRRPPGILERPRGAGRARPPVRAAVARVARAGRRRRRARGARGRRRTRRACRSTNRFLEQVLLACDAQYHGPGVARFAPAERPSALHVWQILHGGDDVDEGGVGILAAAS